MGWQHFTGVHDVPDLQALVDLARQIKADPLRYAEVGKGRSLGMLFFNSSLRTRVSTDLAAAKLGMDRVSLNVQADSWGLEFADGVKMNADKAEHIREAARVLGGYVDILGIRAFPGLKDRSLDYSEQVIEAFKAHAGCSILSLESATLHPLQSLADLLTIREMFSGPKKVRVALRWAPHPRALPQAVPNSFLQWMKSAEGIDIKAVYPEGYDLAPEFMDGVERSHDPNEGLRDVDVIYVKNWSKYEPYAEVSEVDQAQWMLSSDSMRVCPNARVMHCLPVRRNVVIEDTVLDSKNAVVQQQAHNRLWSAAAVLHEMLGGLA